MKTITPIFRTINITLCLLASLALGLPTTVLGQAVTHVAGGVAFQNSESTVQGVTSHRVLNFDNTLLAGTQYKAELYYLDTDTGTFTAIPSTLSSFRSTTTSLRGTWAGPVTQTPLPAGYGGIDVITDADTGVPMEAGDGSGTGMGYYPVTLKVRAWDSTTGGSWESATISGESASFLYTQRFSNPPDVRSVQMVTQPGFQLQAGLVAPGITFQPQGQSGYWGKTVTFTVVAYGTQPLAYQWLKDGASIDGATQFMLSLTNLSTSAAGNYTVVITNSVGSVTSNPALLILNAAGISMGLYPGITIAGVVGNTYGIQYTTNLLQSTAWITATNLTLTDPVQLWVDTNPDAMVGTAPHRTYRIVAVP